MPGCGELQEGSSEEGSQWKGYKRLIRGWFRVIYLVRKAYVGPFW